MSLYNRQLALLTNITVHKDIPMYHTLLFVQIPQRLRNLNNDVPTQILRKVRQPHNLVEQFSAGAQLENQVVISFGLLKVDELDNIRMIQSLHD